METSHNAHSALSTPDSAAPQPHGDDQIPQDWITVAATPPPLPRARRADGWTGEKRRIFLEEMADTGLVNLAAAAAGMSHQSAYALRRRADGADFRIGWDAASRIARQKLADDAYTRATNGTRLYIRDRDREIIEVEYRLNDRLLMQVLARLDRIEAENDHASGVAMQEFDEFLDRMERDADRPVADIRTRASGTASDVAAFFHARRPCAAEQSPGRDANSFVARAIAYQEGNALATVPGAIASESTGQMLERLMRYRLYASADPATIPVDDLDPAQMARWTDEQFERADWSGLLNTIPESMWPMENGEDEEEEEEEEYDTQDDEDGAGRDGEETEIEKPRFSAPCNAATSATSHGTMRAQNALPIETD